MRLKLIAMFCVLMSATLAYGLQTEAEWVKFTSPDGRFSLLLPHQPKLEVVHDPANDKLVHNRFNGFEEGYGFVIECFDNLNITDPELYLDRTRDGILETLKGKLLRESKVSLDAYPGRELELELTANGVKVSVTIRTYVVGSNLYSLSYIRRQDIDAAQAAKIGTRFFSSMKLEGK